jgi:uncharacterized protein YceK
MTELNSEYIGIASIVGEEGSCKSSMALTFPKPLYHFELDIGGFDRAAWRFKDSKILRLKAGQEVKESDLSGYDIISKPYPKALDIGKLMGQLAEGKKTDKAFTVRFPKQLTGVKEQWQDIVTDFITIVQLNMPRSIVFDTASLLYNIAHQTVLQEIQERQVYNWKYQPQSQNGKAPFDENMFRERLQPIEYAPAYERMRSVFQTASSYHKNCIAVHYPTDEYIKNPDQSGMEKDIKSGVKVPDGWKELNKMADLIVWTSVKETSIAGQKFKMPMCKITKCGIAGMGLDAVGKELTASFESIMQERDRMIGGV